MTGRELIVYILENHLEDQLICADGKIIGFLTLEEAAEKFNVGTETVRLWYKLGQIDGAKIGNAIYILANAEPANKIKE